MDFLERKNKGAGQVSKKKISFLIIIILFFVFIFVALFIIGLEKENEVPPAPIAPKEITEGMSDEVAVQIMRNELEKRGLSDIELSIAEEVSGERTRTLVVIYKTEAENQQKLEEEIAFITGTFIGIKKYKDWDIGGLSANVKDNEGVTMGRWYCSKEWVNDFIDEKISAEEFLSKIIADYESS